MSALPESALYLFAGLAGLLVGSFLNVVILRLPPWLGHRMERECREWLEPEGTPPVAEDAPPGIAHPPSHCPRCGHGLSWYENIPVVSFLLLRGRCRHCGGAIAGQYPLVEIGAALLAMATVAVLGPGVEAVAVTALAWTLLALAVIDLREQLLPDALTLPALWAGLLLAAAGFGPAPVDAILGAAAGYGVLWLVAHGYRVSRGRVGMGGGDLKLLAVIGAWAGWQLLPLVILLAAVPAALVGLALLAGGHHRQTAIPFGPYLALGGWLALLWGERLQGVLHGL
ncbi:MAG: prepilin peptidase [Pseudomonadota bacterium]